MDCLRKFNIVKSQAFGVEKGDFIQQSVLDFKSCFQKIQTHLAHHFNYELKVSWKVHILVSHVVPFLEDKKHGLGVFAEQAGESAHHHHGKVWKRFKRRMDHQDHGIQLKKSVTHFGQNNV